MTSRCQRNQILFRGEEGMALSVGVVLLVGVLTLVLGIAVDLAGQVNAKREVADVAAQAARTAAQRLDPGTYLADGGDLEVAAIQAKAEAVEYLKASGMTGTVRIDGDELVVDAHTRYRPLFLSALGVGALEVTGTARVRIVQVLDGKEHP